MGQKNKALFAVAGVVALAVGAWLAFGFFGIQAAFIDTEVAEGGPVFASGAGDTDDESTGDESATAATTDQVTTTQAPTASTTNGSEGPDGTTASTAAEDQGTDEPADETTTTTVADDEVAETTTTEAANEPGEIVTLVSGSFSGQNDYSVAGDALVLNDGSEQRFLRFENFNSDNGPDLKVYLRSSSGDFVDLGQLKGNVGEQNYEIPTDVDLSVFSTVEIWCKRFSASFGAAGLS